METPLVTRHMTYFFDDSLCGLKNVDKRNLTYTNSQVNCGLCWDKMREENIENQRALDTLPHCPDCGELAESVTLTFTYTIVHRFDVQTERDYDSKTIRPMLYSSHYDAIDKELVPEKAYQVICTNGHEWFTKQIEPSDDLTADGGQWFVKKGIKDEHESANLCPVCLCDRSEHNWEVHTAELKNG